MRRDERRSAARGGILAAAHRQVAEGGCASASIAAVAARAGVATGSLYRHFPSRAELLAEVVGDALRGEHALLVRSVEGKAPRDALVAWVQTTVARSLEAPDLANALLLEPSDPAVDAVRLHERRAREATLAMLLIDGAERGAWPDANAEARAAAVEGSLRAALVGPAAAMRMGPRPEVRTEAETLVAFILGAVGAERPERPPRS